MFLVHTRTEGEAGAGGTEQWKSVVLGCNQDGPKESESLSHKVSGSAEPLSSLLSRALSPPTCLGIEGSSQASEKLPAVPWIEEACTSLTPSPSWMLSKVYYESLHGVFSKCIFGFSRPGDSVFPSSILVLPIPPVHKPPCEA